MTLPQGSHAAPTTSGGAAPDDDPQCDMCPHPWSAHDRIGVRFCTASRTSSRTDHVCVCRP